ncbi:MAG: branched-chain amino acid ABC transporter permease [Candidatus Lokiarchaeia archaeon]
MPKKIRTLFNIYRESIKNFFPSLKRSIKNSLKEIPSSIKSLKMRILSFQGGLSIFCLIIISLFPFIPDIEYYASILVIAMIFTIFAASWDLLAGFTGQVSFGHAIFFGISGYIGASLIHYSGLPWFPSLFIGAITAVLFGLIIAIPSLRLKGPYLALGTQAFALIMFNLMLTQEILVIHSSFVDFYFITQYFIILAFMLISLIIMTLIVKSKVGTIFKSIRDDEICAEASGINTTKYKILAFMISSFFAGVAGGLFAVNISSVSFANFAPLYSFFAILMAAIGGLGTISGAALGAFTFWIVNEGLRDFGEFAVLFFAIFLILVIRFSDRGIMKPAIERLKELFDILIGR